MMNKSYTFKFIWIQTWAKQICRLYWRSVTCDPSNVGDWESKKEILEGKQGKSSKMRKDKDKIQNKFITQKKSFKLITNSFWFCSLICVYLSHDRSYLLKDLLQIPAWREKKHIFKRNMVKFQFWIFVLVVINR